MITSIIILVVGWAVSIIGLFHKNKGGIGKLGWTIAFLLTTGMTFGIYKICDENRSQKNLKNELTESESKLQESIDSAADAATSSAIMVKRLAEKLADSESKKQALELQKDLEELAQRQKEKKAYVILYKDDHFKGRAVRFNFKEDLIDFHQAKKGDFDNEASSAVFDIPPGWKVQLFGDNSFRGGLVEMTGKDKFEDIEKKFNKGDEGSSLRWVKE